METKSVANKAGGSMLWSVILASVKQGVVGKGTFLVLLFFTWKLGVEEEREMDIFHLQVHSPNGHTSQFWAK